MNTSVVSEIIAEMRKVAPAGQQQLAAPVQARLMELTKRLAEAQSGSLDEYWRFRNVAQRGLEHVDGHLRAALHSMYAGKRILVTGLTGCVGTALHEQLTHYEPALIVGVAHPRERAARRPEVYYQDIADSRRVSDIVGEVRPDVVFHVAAQRNPGLAEREVTETILSNVVGTSNVLSACEQHSVPVVVHASTGKAMRYLTHDVYAVTKKIAEWQVHEYARRGHRIGAVRFTHVVDNAVVLQRFAEAIACDNPVRVHEPDIGFYVQSARESAELLTLSGLNTTESLRVLAIRCLGEPVHLVPMVLGFLEEMEANSTPIYFSGFDAGYERGTAPGLYDPQTASELSPLINAVEAPSAEQFYGASTVDSFALALPALPTDLVSRLHEASTVDVNHARTELMQAATMHAEAQLGQCPEPLFRRLDSMARRAGRTLPTSRKATEAGSSSTQHNHALAS